MAPKEVKSEILKVLETIPENVLEDILNYLQEIQKKDSSSIQLSKHLSKILREDTELLRKLAQ